MIAPDQLATMTDYLSRNFPEKPKPAGVVLPGSVKVTMTSWTVPTPGSRPHDPLATRDGALWYTGQMNNVLGGDSIRPRASSRSSRSRRRTPARTGSSKTRTAISDDVIWYSESGTSPNTVVRFEPKTEKFQSWAIPGGGDIVRNTSVTLDGDFVLASSLVNAVTLVRIAK